MINYLLNYVLCNGLLLLAYHLLLKNKALYRFNRFYLLFSLVFPLLVPLIVVHTTSTPIPLIRPVTEQSAADIVLLPEPAGMPQSASVMQHITDNSYSNIGYIVYVLVAGLLLFRFVKNLYTIGSSIWQHEHVIYHQAKLILISKQVTPHSFLQYIFLNRKEYLNNQIEPAILDHELAHVRQYHSVDIILLELIQIACWFNPFLWFYRKAIQLNHEFLADAAVINQHYDIINYQRLLLDKLSLTASLSYTSQFNYAITKQRLLMMTKQTSATQAWLAKVAIMPVVAIATLLFCIKTEAMQQLPSANKKTRGTLSNVTIQSPEPLNARYLKGYPCTQEGASADLLKEYATLAIQYKALYKKGQLNHSHDQKSSAARTRMEQIFKQMSRAQQRRQEIGFMLPPPVPMFRKMVPTQTQFDLFQNKEYGLWIDGKHTSNDILKEHNPTDFEHVFVSRLSPKAINYKNYKYEVDLMTKPYFDQLRNHKITGSIMYHHVSPQNNRAHAQVVSEAMRLFPPHQIADSATKEHVSSKWAKPFRLLGPTFSLIKENLQTTCNSKLSDNKKRYCLLLAIALFY